MFLQDMFPCVLYFLDSFSSRLSSWQGFLSLVSLALVERSQPAANLASVICETDVFLDNSLYQDKV